MHYRRLCRTKIADCPAIRHNNRAESKLVVSSLRRILPALGREIVNTRVTSSVEFQSNKNCTRDQGGVILGPVGNKQMSFSVLLCVCFADSHHLLPWLPAHSPPSLLFLLSLSFRSLTITYWPRTLMSKEEMRGQTRKVHWEISILCGHKHSGIKEV